MRINLSRPGQWCAGLGDVVTWAWMANGADQPIEFVANGANAELLELLGQPVTTDAAGSVDPTVCYRTELDERGERPRVDVWSEQAGFTTLPVRPVFDGGRTLKPVRKRIVLCPQSHFRCRTWPAFYWIDLNWGLLEQGYEVIFSLESNHQEFSQRGPSIAYWGHGFQAIADLFCSADLVVSNDSFPAHFAGTLGVDVLALCGPTKASCFVHIPEVTPIGSRFAGCTGCHFGRPYRDVCDIGCQSLYTLLPCDVLGVIKSLTERSDDAGVE